MIDGPFASKLMTYTAPTALVIDDVGLLRVEAGRGAYGFFHVVNHRYEKRHPTIVTTNRGLQRLPRHGRRVRDPRPAHARRNRLQRPSWRLREHQALADAGTDSDPEPSPRRRR